MFEINLEVFENLDIIFTLHLINISLFLIPNVEFVREVVKI